ncbi:FAS1 domain-containing protein [Sparassis latifolia]|uniref:FAS1 domain-containing protein n=1 Tax=Sparassis crispa TaxID=139825 RepID=A0A401G917_9APHY|nr:hypothetical protein SCP_0115280 [Sparassis crispa]GBE78639.1 hypothetical protein SCP_0115280 [Sparassis crispa]
MKLSLVPCTLLAAVSAVVAQTQNTTFLTGFIETLQGMGLTDLTTFASQINDSSFGEALLATISDGKPYLFFAPSNDAFMNAPENVTANPPDTLAYHYVSGNFSGDMSMYPNVTLGRTFLNDSMFVQLEGNKSQVLAWTKLADGAIHILNQMNDTMVTNTTMYGNITINVINTVLSFPPSLSDVVMMDMNASLSSLQTVLQEINVEYFNASTGETHNTSTFDVLNMGAHGFTLFAPNSSALDAISSALQSLSNNQTLADTILLNHVINGTSVYSSELVGMNYTSAAGEPLLFMMNTTGQYVTSGNVTAKIIQPDVLLSNGVIHVIDRVFLNEKSDMSAASSAAASATSAAGHSTTESAPIGFSQTASLTASGSNAAQPSNSKSAAVATYAQSGSTKMWAVGLTVLGAIVGGYITLS